MESDFLVLDANISPNEKSMETEDYCLIWIVFLGSCLESKSTWKKNIKENNFFMFSFTVKYIYKKLNIIKIIQNFTYF